jgi:hypothetical protein
MAEPWPRKTVLHKKYRARCPLFLNAVLAFMPAGKQFHAKNISLRVSGPLVRP